MSEPGVSWEAENLSFNTYALRNQLGAVRSPINRNIMSITTESFNTSLSQARLAQKTAGASDISSSSSTSSTSFPAPFNDKWRWLQERVDDLSFHSILFCPHCPDDSDGYLRASTILSATFQQTIEETNRPALAVQAAITSVMRTTYYDMIDAFVPNGTATATFLAPFPTPTTRRGFFIVTGIVLAHSLLVFAVLLLFAAQTQNSWIGQVWCTIAQVTNSKDEAVQKALAIGATARDDEIEHFIKHGKRPVPMGSMEEIEKEIREMWKIFGGKSEAAYMVRDNVVQQTVE